MANAKHPDNDLIATLGRKRVADHFGLTPQGLYNWTTRGIPDLKRIAFAKLCAENAVPVPPGFFDSFEVAA